MNESKKKRRRKRFFECFNRIPIKTSEQIEGIRRASQLTCEILDGVGALAKPGISTNAINDWVHEYTISHNAIPAPLNYRGFPKSICTSINEVVCHGIPSDRLLIDGDIINIDVTSILDGYYGDASRMFAIGTINPEAQRLIDDTKTCLDIGIEHAIAGNTFGDIGYQIQTYAEAKGYSVVRAFTGHGIGTKFHEPPEVQHVGKPGHGPQILPGMVFTIEPMINLGGYEIEILADNWTAVTKDRSLSAQWEHTIAITEQGVDILTA